MDTGVGAGAGYDEGVSAYSESAAAREDAVLAGYDAIDGFARLACSDVYVSGTDDECAVRDFGFGATGMVEVFADDEVFVFVVYGVSVICVCYWCAFADDAGGGFG